MSSTSRTPRTHNPPTPRNPPTSRNPPASRNPPGLNAESVPGSDSDISISLDTLIHAVKSFGRFGRLVDQQGRSSTDIAELRSWTIWDIRRDLAQGLAGLCVLHAPATKKAGHRPTGNKKPNVVASTLLFEDNPRWWNLLCTGNRPLDTNDNPYGKFFRDSIPLLTAIASAANRLTVDPKDLALTNVRDQHEILSQAEKAFVLWAYDCHLPKLKLRIKKRGVHFAILLREYISKNKLLGDPTLGPLLNDVRELTRGIELDPSELNGDKIHQLHRAGRRISSALRNKTLCKQLNDSKIMVQRRTSVDILRKIATGSTYVNNLVLLATCTQLGRDLLAADKFHGPTFIEPSPLSENFAPGTIDGNRLYRRYDNLCRRVPTMQSTEIKPERNWQSTLKRVQPTDSHSFKDTHVHCECVIAVEILKQRRKGRYYIGCPKLSCTPCFLFLEAVNEVGKQPDIGIEIVMDGTHGTWYLPWSIPRDTPHLVQEAFERVLLSSINRLLDGSEGKGNAESNSDAAVDIAPYDI